MSFKKLILVVLVLLCSLTFASNLSKVDRSSPPFANEKSNGGEMPSISASKAACAAKVYFDNIRPHAYGSALDVGGSNVGFKQKMAEDYQNNKCLRVALEKFYQQIDKADEATEQARRRHLTDAKLPKPLMSASVSALGVPEYKDGWLFEAAMKSAGRDPHLAMQLIAFCGHDDVTQIGSPRPPLENESFVNGRTGEESTLKQKKSQKKANKPTVDCPPASSLFYFPRSLDSGVDTQVTAREALQGQRDLTRSPAKAYHTLFASFLGCNLAEKCNATPKEAAKLGRRFGSFYRGVRMDSMLSGLVNSGLKEIAEYENFMKSKSTPESEKKFSKLVQLFARSRSSSDMAERSSYSVAIRTMAAYLIKQENSVLFSSISKSSVKKELSSAEMEALFKLSDEEIAKKGIESARLLVDWDSESFKQRCRKLARESCDEVIKMIKDWNADSVWTMNQHSVGATFGAEQCQSSAFRRAGGKPQICASYESQPDITRENMSHRGEKAPAPKPSDEIPGTEEKGAK